MKHPVNDAMVRAFAKQSWPDPDTDLLVKAVLLPQSEARQHWHQWLSYNNIDDCTWPQFKLLVRLSGRLRDIDPGCSEIPRLNGMAKALWTKSQLQLNAATRCIDELNKASIEIYLIKTAAFEAVNPAFLTRRVTSDLDFMVRRNRLLEAMQLLFSQGWRGPATFEQALERSRRNPGVNLRLSDPQSQIEADADIHHQPVHLPYLPDAIVDQIWTNAVNASFRGRAVLVPRLEELVVFTAMQGTRRFIPSHLSSGMWPMDLAELFRSKQLSPHLLLQLADQFRGNWALLSCLTYLEDELGVELPDGLIEGLISKCSGWTDAIQFYAQAPSYGSLKYLHLPVRELALLASQQGFRRQVRDHGQFAF